MSDFRLRVFSSVAKNLSFTKASQELFISQPAITKHIYGAQNETYIEGWEKKASKLLIYKRLCKI